MIIIKEILEIAKLIVDRDVELSFTGVSLKGGIPWADGVKFKLSREKPTISGKPEKLQPDFERIVCD